MEIMQKNKKKRDSNAIFFWNKRLYFKAQTERKFYFVLTMIALIVGIAYKIGLL